MLLSKYLYSFSLLESAVWSSGTRHLW